ncbi:hypothetical protein GJ744_010615 [Endocarpon pusillum]|uniref:Vacuolar membrane protein n=1 Tax=Endocarpon pusillum TaxID=364733 RepID=A0A8H7E7F0_9EURO|nr:hypothetical protein GJ744_010615 [Endocarpon pusillum]
MDTSSATHSAAFQIATIIASSTDILLQTVEPPPVPSPTPTPSSSPPDGSQNTGECELLGPFAILVQAALGGLALLSLVYKRWRERPQRPLKIWAFDASKQVFGSGLLHLANLLMSMFSAGQIQASVAKYQPNPCSFYLLNLAIDTTLGIPILIVILRVLTAGASLTPLGNPPESILSGNYGTPPRATWWLKQSMIYFMGLLGMKACVFIIFELLPWIVQVGDWALRWTEGNEAIQIAFVLLIFPLIMNAMQYYIIDSFIKNKAPPQDDDTAAEVGEDGALLADDEALDDQEAGKEDRKVPKDRPSDLPKNSLARERSFEQDTPEASSSGGIGNVEEEALNGKYAR